MKENEEKENEWRGGWLRIYDIVIRETEECRGAKPPPFLHLTVHE